MLTSFSVTCPRPECRWIGNLIPSAIRGGREAEIAEHAWFRCPLCEHDWEVRIVNDRVTAAPAIPHGG